MEPDDAVAELPPAGGWRGAVTAVAARPGLWPTAVVQLLRLAPPGWWRRWPPLPRPDPAYLAFRLETAYGDAGHPPVGEDVVAFLAWCRSMRRPGRDRR